MANSPTPRVTSVTGLDPEHTFRATSISQMWAIAPALRDLNVIYNVGIRYPGNVIVYTVKNLTVSHMLQFKLFLPDFLIAHNTNIILDPLGEFKFEVSVNEELVRRMDPRILTNDVQLSVTPLNVLGPVFIKKDATPPSDGNSPIPSTSTTPTGSSEQPVDEFADLTQFPSFVEKFEPDPLL